MSPPSLTLIAPDGPAPRPLAERPDEELMVGAAGGSEAAFAVLVERYLGRVASFCAKHTGDRAAAEELAQDTFLQLWARRAHYRPERPFPVLLFTAARNRCRNHRRGWWRRLRWIGDADDRERAAAPASGDDQLELLLRRERERRITDAIGRLPAKLREAVLLRFDQGLDYAAIAAIAGCPEATARTRAFHGVRQLREALEQEES